ncbi:MAG: hypothetical protein Q7J70_01225, partial [Thermodesulfovibrionales bacterium]|nr:hypothetical protein [Thermodesulfovibrionales bacterium]
MIRKYVMVSVIAFLFVISFIGCTTMPVSQQKEVVKYVANFSYTLSVQEKPDSAGVTFAVESVNYQSPTGTLWLLWPQFANLDAAMKQDLTKILGAKGITVRGPFDSHDLIPYQDKKASDLYAVPVLNLSIVLERGWSSVEVSGKFTLLLKEIMTGELMWSKTIPLTSFSVQNIGSFRVTKTIEDRLIQDLPLTANRNDV